MASELEDRRQRAREAAYDTIPDGACYFPQSIETAIEAATRVQITPEVAEHYSRNLSAALAAGRWGDGMVVRAALEAAGFEVVD